MAPATPALATAQTDCTISAWVDVSNHQGTAYGELDCPGGVPANTQYVIKLVNRAGNVLAADGPHPYGGGAVHVTGGCSGAYVRSNAYFNINGQGVSITSGEWPSVC